MHVSRLALPMKLYIAIMGIITLTFLYFGYYDAIKTKQSVYAEQERTLIQIAVMLEQKLPKPYSQLIEEETDEPLKPDEKRAILRKKLQPIIDDAAKQFPGYLMGFGDYEQIIAAPADFQLVPTKAGKAVYTQMKMVTAINDYSPIWGASSLSVSYPLTYNGAVYGHIGVSTRLADIENAYWQSWLRNLLIYLLLWLAITAILRKLFLSLSATLSQLSIQIRNGADIETGVRIFPELKPVLETVIELRTDLKSKAEQIEEQKKYLEDILNSIQDAFYCLDKNMIFTYCNKETKKFFGYDPTGMDIWTCLPDANLPQQMYKQVILEQQPLYFEMQSIINKKWIGLNIYPNQDGGLSVFFRDIDEEKKINEELLQAKERFLKAFNLNPNLMMLTSLEEEARYIDVNDAFAKASGLKREEIIGRSINEFNLFADMTQRAEVRKLIFAKGSIANYELKYRYGGAVKVGLLSAEKIEIGGKPCIINVITDITAKKQLDEELARYASLNLVGEIAASIGHEVRNPMSTVRGYLQLFQRKKQFADYHEDLGIMIEELDRANTIITEFLSLAKNKSFDLIATDLQAVINTIFPLIQADAFRLGHNIQVKLEPIPLVMLDEREIRQLILNLVRNAFEAMEQNGMVCIKTYMCKNETILEVSDTGKGIPPEIQNKLGTPFFTTKENGTGLGLAVCYRIAQRHNAAISAMSGKTGTSFLIKFPNNMKIDE
ncbi:PAS domain S-box protein [Sporomusa aerivorans]|uniref:PAS domain S-box protein n=1 Tax=Sporomusa aerivorans TaxID=204936 RepID=UPI00352B3C2A